MTPTSAGAPGTAADGYRIDPAPPCGCRACVRARAYAEDPREPGARRTTAVPHPRKATR